MCPVHVEKRPIKSGKDFAIVETSTGRIKGRSKTKSDAQKSANARNAAHSSGWKPTGRK